MICSASASIVDGISVVCHWQYIMRGMKKVMLYLILVVLTQRIFLCN